MPLLLLHINRVLSFFEALLTEFLVSVFLILRSRCPLGEIVIQGRSSSYFDFKEDGSIRAGSHRINSYSFKKI
ncbi:hypothetical protein [Clostridium sp.]|uniref:hypothetical protein n=1 Tax=Clostridium sp. TaxID=1506 RepID=UPI003216A858